MNPQGGPDDGWIRYVPLIACRLVAEGGRVQRVEPDTAISGRLAMVLLPAHALRDPKAGLHFLPRDLYAGVGSQDLAVGRV